MQSQNIPDCDPSRERQPVTTAIEETRQRDARPICVFSPTPMLTVTIEQSADGTAELHIHAGGQGFWVARMIARLGQPVTLCAPFGGDTGGLLEGLIADEGVGLAAVECSGTSGSYVHDRRTGERVEIARVPGARLSRHEYDDLYNAAFTAAMNSRLLILTGQFPSPVIPAQAYARLASDLRNNGVQVIGDLSGDEMRDALHGGLDLLCFSHEELVSHKYAASERIEDLIAGIRKLQSLGAAKVILHRGSEPALALDNDRLLEIHFPQVTPADHRGGGDTFFAALAVGLVQEADMEATLKFAAAAGTLNVTRHGLGTGRRESVLQLMPHVRIVPVTIPGE